MLPTAVATRDKAGGKQALLNDLDFLIGEEAEAAAAAATSTSGTSAPYALRHPVRGGLVRGM